MGLAVLALGVCGGAPQVRADTEIRVPGDLNEPPDGRVDAADLMLLLLHLRGESTLTDERFDAADLAPLVDGEREPDGEVNAADLLVLMQLQKGDAGPDAPVLNSTSPAGLSANPISVSGTAEEGVEIHLFVNGVEQVAPQVVGASEAFTFTDVALVDNDENEGQNPIFAVAMRNGLASRPSNTLTRDLEHTTGGPGRSPSNNVAVSEYDETSGDHIVVWTARDSSGTETAFQFGGNLTVDAGYTLVLTETTALTFAAGKKLRVCGDLRIEGRENEKIVFTGPWQGIHVDSSCGTSSFKIDFASVSGANVGVQIDGNGTVDGVITNSSIATSDNTASSGVLIDAPNADVGFDGNVVTLGISAYPTGIKLTSFQSATVSDSTISGLGNGINLTAAGSPTIVGNEILGVSGSAGTVGISITEPVGSAVSTPLIDGNRIRFFQTNVNLVGVGTPVPTEFPRPIIRNNSIRTAGLKNVAINTTAINIAKTVTVEAQFNYWGSTVLSSIASSIAGGHSNPQAPLIDFAPFRESFSGPIVYQYVLGRVDSDESPTFDTSPTAPDHLAIGPIVVPPAETGTIPAGVTLLMNTADHGAHDVRVFGQLLIDGVVGNEVVLRSGAATPQAGDWLGITLENTADDSVISGAIIEHTNRAIDVKGATNVTIEDSTIRLFKDGESTLGTGVAYTDGASGTIQRNTIDNTDGPLDQGTGIDIEDSSPTLSDNVVQNTLAGIHVKGSANPVIGTFPPPAFPDNVITGNTWGIWLEAATPNLPNPSIRGNRIQGNTRDPMVTGFPPPANIRLSGYPPGNVAQIAATENDWGTTVEANILAGIRQDQPENPVVVDFSEYTDASGDIVGGSPVYSSYIRDVEIASPNRTFTPTLASDNTISVSFETLVTADVQVRIYPELATDFSPSAALWSDTIESATPGTQTVIWDGKDTSDLYVPDEAYVYLIQVGDGSTSSEIYNPPRDESAIPEGEGVEQLAPDNATGLASLAFNPYENDFLKVNYRLQSPADPGRVYLRIDSDLGNPPTNFFAEPVNGIPIELPGATQQRVWSGRNLANSLHSPFARAHFPVPKRLKPNFVIVQQALPVIRGPDMNLDQYPGFDEVEVRPDPFRVTHSYDQVLGFKYCVDQDALVTIKVLKPGTSDPDVSANVAATLLSETLRTGIANCTTGNAYSIPAWDGRDATGKLVTEVDGIYTLAIVARNTDSAQSHLRTIYRGVLQLRR